jgi:glycosyltransferase involved in cell wall biosynthesis
MKLSIIIPAYNEEHTLGKVLCDIFALKLDFDFEVIVVDDGSTDLTASEAQSCGFAVTYLNQHKNLGKGLAIRRGMKSAKGEFILIQDADCEYDPQDYPALLKPLFSGEAEVVYGSRILKETNKRSYTAFYWGGRLLSWWTNLLYGSCLTDESTGYKAFTSEVLKSLGLSCKGFEFCPEVTARLLLQGKKIVEVPISYYPRTIEDGKKISWKDGVLALWILLKLRVARDA